MASPNVTRFFVCLTVVMTCLASCVIAVPGKFSNCGSVPFNMTWSPDPISPSKPLKVHVAYEFPHVLDGGFYDVTIWFHGDPDPFLEFADSFSCSDITKYFTCPIKQDFKIVMTKVFEHIPNIGSYPGDYDVKVNVENTKHQQLICLKGHVQILKN